MFTTHGKRNTAFVNISQNAWRNLDEVNWKLFQASVVSSSKKKVSFLSRGIPLSNRYLFLYKKTNFKVISFIKLLQKSLKKLPLISPGVNVSGSVA